MSRNVLTCAKCKKPIAHFHHTGRIEVLTQRPVILPDGRVLARCECGEKRIITRQPTAA